MQTEQTSFTVCTSSPISFINFTLDLRRYSRRLHAIIRDSRLHLKILIIEVTYMERSIERQGKDIEVSNYSVKGEFMDVWVCALRSTVGLIIK